MISLWPEQEVPVHEKTPRRTVFLCAEAEFPRCHSASPGRARSFIHVPVIHAVLVTGTFPVDSYSQPFGSPSEVHSHSPHAPPFHCRRLPVPCRRNATSLPHRFRWRILLPRPSCQGSVCFSAVLPYPPVSVPPEIPSKSFL